MPNYQPQLADAIRSFLVDVERFTSPIAGGRKVEDMWAAAALSEANQRIENIAGRWALAGRGQDGFRFLPGAKDRAAKSAWQRTVTRIAFPRGRQNDTGGRWRIGDVIKDEDIDALRAAAGALSQKADELIALSQADAARLLSDLTGAKLSTTKPRISHEIKSGRLQEPVTEGQIARRAVDILKYKPKVRTSARPLGKFTCPVCHKNTHKLMGAARVCHGCFLESYGLR